uniref:non-specific serine/threonine protein kinase n=1 Tax=Oryza meridionalis TaxID=40149 RepID=A0A0E0DJC3_9ORYZ
MNRVHGLHLIVLTSLCCVALSAGEGDRRSVLWRGVSIAVEDAADSVLVSPSGNFSWRPNAYTLAVWFTASADATVAWTANRDTPVNGVGSRAELRKDGSLVLQDYDGRVVWSTNTSGTPADRAQLLDTGNLVVSDAAGNRLWQSFDWPTDTLLPEQPVTRYRQLVSAAARGSPYSGYYKFYFDSSNILNLMYDGPEISSNYWPDPFKKWWDNNRTAFNSSRHGSFDRRGVFTASDQLQFNASDMGDGGVMRRLTLDYDGNLRLYSLDAAAGRWHVTWVAVQRQCDVHGLCGRYGICTYSQGPTCSCPDGYVPHDASDWSKGCRRTFGVRCGEDVAFAEMRHADYWGFDLNYTAGISFDTCRRELSDATCGFRDEIAKGGTGSVYKGVLEDGRSIAVKRLGELTQADEPENILLDGDFEPKVTDFGLVKLLSRDAGSHMALSRVQGTRGYIAPECWTVGRPITGKADVYSFGVVLLELLRGQRVCDWVAAADGAWDLQRLAAWLKEKLKRDDGELPAWLEELVDARLRGDFNHVQAAAMLELAVCCVDGEPNRRPSMSTVVHKLISLDTIEHHLYATHELSANAAVVSLVGDVGGINCVCRVEDLNCFSC